MGKELTKEAVARVLRDLKQRVTALETKLKEMGEPAAPPKTDSKKKGGDWFDDDDDDDGGDD